MIILDMKVDRLIACNILFIQWQIFYAYPGQEKWIKKTISSFSKGVENLADVNQWNAVRRFWITDEGTYKVIHTFKSVSVQSQKSSIQLLAFVAVFYIRFLFIIIGSLEFF